MQLLIVFGSMLAYLVLAALVSLVLRTFEVKAFCNMLLAAWLVFWVVLLMGSVSTLLLFRFPPEYVRLISILVYVIPACVFMGAGSIFVQEIADNPAVLPAAFSAMLLPAACHTHTVPGGLRTVLFLQLPCLSEERSDITGKERFA